MAVSFWNYLQRKGCKMTHWTMRDKTEIAIKDMTTLHIQNTVKMLKRNLIVREAFQKLGDLMVDIAEATTPVSQQINDNQLQNLVDDSNRLTEKYIAAQAKTRMQISAFEAELLRRETN